MIAQCLHLKFLHAYTLLGYYNYLLNAFYRKVARLLIMTKVIPKASSNNYIMD